MFWWTLWTHQVCLRRYSTLRMKILIPLDKTSSSDVETLRRSHLERKFIVFDEDLRIFFHPEPNTVIETVRVYINEACVYNCDKTEECLETSDNGLLELKRSIASEYIFHSTIVMNNGHKNLWRIKVETAQDVDSKPNENGEECSRSDEMLLPSFEPLGSAIPVEKVFDPSLQQTLTTTEVVYPIHTLLNVRLRNVAVPIKQCIYSCLDLQTSRACYNLLHQYELSNFHISIESVDYRLIRNYSNVAVKPLCPLSSSLKLGLSEGYSVNFQLPQTKNLESHRVKVSVRYIVHAHPFEFAIETKWETDVTLRKQQGMAGYPSQPTSVMSTPMLTPSMKFNSSFHSLVSPSKLSNVKFNFLTPQRTFSRGTKFSLSLQIVNNSQAPIDCVVYSSKNAVAPQGQYPVEKEYLLHKQWVKNTDAIVLLSNDLKLPTVPPTETLSADVEFFALLPGYYHGISGLKILDLTSQETASVGNGIKLLIE
ncbi:LADA_0D11144g1_1 [Lachancea dasiensis]|uniref:LADA_0D11144g1_1 n=1 Tax=Lachancea dasiensis TaxID=1072105 RepID=A0A1G4J841_9SACH|nr:LADA_0D11144g1_1 [Lachancea dasiensis]